MTIVCPRCQGTKKSHEDTAGFGENVPPCDFCNGKGHVDKEKAYPEHLTLLAETLASQIVDNIVRSVQEADGKVEDTVPMGAHKELIEGVRSQLAQLGKPVFYAIYDRYFADFEPPPERTIKLPNPICYIHTPKSNQTPY